jgi:hypothetical protein
MAATPPAAPRPDQTNLARWLLLVFAALLGLNMGAALFSSVVVFPVWSGSPEAAVGWQRVVDEGRFFVVISPLALVLAVATLLVSGRVDRTLRFWVRTAAALYLVFFVVISPLALVLAVATLLVSGRVDRTLRFWVRTAATLYLVFFVATLVYFVPGQAALQGDAAALLPPEELGASLRRWVALNWVRQAVGLLTFGAALHALGLSYAGTHSAAATRRIDAEPTAPGDVNR